jgi:hypothetical protein
MSEEIFKEFSNELNKRLTRKEKHSELLKTLLQWLEEGGGEAVEDGIKEMVKRIKGE